MSVPDSHRFDDDGSDSDAPNQPDDPCRSDAPHTSNAKIRIHHEIVRVRRQAEAARLEANAARLEASAAQLEEMMARIDAGETLSDAELTRAGIGKAIEPKSNAREASQPLSPDQPARLSAEPQPFPADVSVRFESWDAIRQARASVDPTTGPTMQHRVDAAQPSPRRPRMHSLVPNKQESQSDGTDQRLDQPNVDDLEVVEKDQIKKEDRDRETADTLTSDTESDWKLPSPAHVPPVQLSAVQMSAGQVPPVPAAPVPAAPVQAAPVQVSVDEDSPQRRRHPLALVLSATVHLLILLILGGFTLSNAMPKDQVALSASVSESSEAAMETFQIEAVEPVSEPTEVSTNESQYDVSPLGEMASVDVTSDVVAAVSQPVASMASLSQPNLQNSKALKALKSDAKSKMEFCGVEGGGNHFVYLVDSSGSMGDAFVSARRALLESIEMLSPEQRFYVIFFDANCDYMRITRADQDEPRSVYATVENKQKLKSWAMRVSMDRGKAPYEPLEYALQTLKPDVIFLLSDGEFPQKIEEILQVNNLVTNLFGDENPVSIIHTISYYSREGESRMRRIAEQNHGQYRHIPKPKSR